MTINKLGDDFNQNRLLSYLRTQLPYEIEEFIPLRKNVFFVKTPAMTFILKGYSSHRRLILMQSFTESLRKEGFQNTYQYIDIFKNGPFLFESKYFGCLEFIEHSNQNFSYHRKKDRNDGLRLLESFHHTTKLLVNRYQTLISHFELINKWQERLDKFIENIPTIRLFINQDRIDELVAWANWSLKGMKKEQNFINKDPLVILHGDVAHHNFIRGSNRMLYLIDFDLISIGGASIDYLQYANRILPFLQWSFPDLSNYKQINPFLKEKAFLYALAYPTDIFREWNRINKEKNYHNSKKVRPILHLTNDQFYQRKHFIKQIQKNLV